MADNSSALFGGETVQAALPGSYGVAPRGYRLPDATTLGPVQLQVADLARSLAFYQQVMGLSVLEQEAGAAWLAAPGEERPLLRLVERKGARSAQRPGRLGLYHYAILLPDRPSLGRFLGHLAALGLRPGAGDHLVSEALYLHDPDGLGIEVYADRPRESWRRTGAELMLATDPVDLDDLLRSAGDTPWSGMPAGTVMGHVHLHVGDLQRAAEFFAEGIGFDRITWRYPGALFMGAGGYHHHLGTNTWAGSGAQPPAGDDARLLEWTIQLPGGEGERARLAESLAAAGYPAERASSGDLRVVDPWGTALRITPSGAD